MTLRKPNIFSANFVNRDEPKYKVVRITEKSGRKTILAKNLSREEAAKMVMRYPSNMTSMVVFYKQ